MGTPEGDFKSKLRREIEHLFPGCFIFKLDTSAYQGAPDMLILFQDRWAVLEVKRSAQAPYQPNQRHYIHELNEMSFSAAIYPENKKEILDAMEQALYARRATRLS